MLWEELAADFGHKPLVAGHTGAECRRLGLGAAGDSRGPCRCSRPRRRPGGRCVACARRRTDRCCRRADLREPLADGRLQAAEWLGPLPLAAPDLQPLAQRLYQPGFNRNGMLLSLDVRRPLWDGMSAADRAIFEGCAAQEYQLSLTDAAAHALIGGR